MKVSVVILAYNEEEFIQRVLDSLEKQTEKADEVIVVDNNSTDKTAQIAKQYKVKIIPEKKQGIVYARNTGFDAARYELIIRFDADTIVPKDYISRVKKRFAQDLDLLAFSGKTTFEPLPNKVPTFWFEVPFNYGTQALFGTASLVGTNLAIRKSAWEKVKSSLCIDGHTMHEDMDLAFHLSKIGKIVYDPQMGVIASSRRVVFKPGSFFVKYTMMGIRTFLRHRSPFSEKLS